MESVTFHLEYILSASFWGHFLVPRKYQLSIMIQISSLIPRLSANCLYLFLIVTSVTLVTSAISL